MKITQNKNGTITVKAENKTDSKHMMRMLVGDTVMNQAESKKSAGERRDPVRMSAIIEVIKKEAIELFGTEDPKEYQVLNEAKRRYTAIFRIPYSTKKIAAYGDDGILHVDHPDHKHQKQVLENQ